MFHHHHRRRLYIFFLSGLFLYNKKRFFPFTVYPCRMCEQMERRGDKTREEEGNLESIGTERERENVYKNEQNSTNTRTQPMRQNKDRERGGRQKTKRRCRMN